MEFAHLLQIFHQIVSSSSTAAHRVLRHGYLPGFLRGRVAGLPHSAHQNQTQAEEKSGNRSRFESERPERARARLYRARSR